MMSNHPFASLGKAAAAIAGMALAGGLAGCADQTSFTGVEGVPLAQLDLGGEAPHMLTLAGPDTVHLREGEKLAIRVEGPDNAVAAMRFRRDGRNLAIMRAGKVVDGETATVHVTMPAPHALRLAGSGRIEAERLAPDAKVTVAGSGRVITDALQGERLAVDVAGSGRYHAGGSVERLKLNIAGSGKAKMDDLTVDSANVTIAGSGKGAFRSDGEVKAKIIGSGKVTVVGRARCDVTAMGSGKLVCKEA